MFSQAMILQLSSCKPHPRSSLAWVDFPPTPAFILGQLRSWHPLTRSWDWAGKDDDKRAVAERKAEDGEE